MHGVSRGKVKENEGEKLNLLDIVLIKEGRRTICVCKNNGETEWE